MRCIRCPNYFLSLITIYCRQYGASPALFMTLEVRSIELFYLKANLFRNEVEMHSKGNWRKKKLNSNSVTQLRKTALSYSKNDLQERTNACTHESAQPTSQRDQCTVYSNMLFEAPACCRASLPVSIIDNVLRSLVLPFHARSKHCFRISNACIFRCTERFLKGDLQISQAIGPTILSLVGPQNFNRVDTV